MTTIRGDGGYRQLVVQLLGGRCVLCGIKDGRLEIDHIIPVSNGGQNDPTNLRILCYEFHRKIHGSQWWRTSKQACVKCGKFFTLNDEVTRRRGTKNRYFHKDCYTSTQF